MSDLSAFLEQEVFPRLTPEDIFTHPAHQFQKGAGKWRGGCPWHPSESGTSFNVTAENRLWYCGGCCFGGGPVQYLHRLRGGNGSPRGLEFVEIAKALAMMAGVEFPERQISEEEQEKARLWDARRGALMALFRVCEAALWGEKGEQARAYLASRGFTEADLRELGFGYYERTAVVWQALRQNGCDVNTVKRWGLLNDDLTGYIVIPWNDDQGRPLTGYGRYQAKAPPEGLPKTTALPGQDTKSVPLYFDRARKAGHKDLVLVEGVLDAAFLQARGETNVVACVAAQLSKQQTKTLARHRIQSVTICLDPDQAGAAGILSCLRSLEEVGIEACVAPWLPESMDPDEFAHKYGVDAWREHLTGAIHGWRHRARHLIGQHRNGKGWTDASLSNALREAGQIASSAKDPAAIAAFFIPEIAAATGVAPESVAAQATRSAAPTAALTTNDGEPLSAALDKARALIDVGTLRERLKENRSSLLESDEALQALAHLRKFDAKTWARVKDLYRELRFSVKDLEKALPTVQIVTREEEAYDGPAPRTSAEFLSDSPAPQLIIPEPYRLADHMTARSSVDDEGTPQLTTFAFAPILITGRLRDADDGTEHLRVSWRRPQQGWIDRTVDRGQAFNPRELLKLASVGAPVADDNAKDISAYLHRVEAANQHNLPCARVSSHLAWQGPMGKDGFLWGRQLILPNGTQTGDINLDELPPDDWREDFIAFHGNAQGDDLLAAGFTASGSMEGWIDAVKVLADFPKPLLGIYASFAAVLLEVTGAPNHVWDWANRTSTGKTTTLRVAGSVWGNPDEKSDASVIGTWDATRVYAERASGVLSNLPLILDDTKRAKNPRDVAAMLYAVANGRGRGRGNPKGLATTKAWRTILLSSGEAPATSFTEDGGTKTRCLEIRGAPFGKETEETRRLVTRINYGVTAHYGHAGPAFVRYLYQNRGKWDAYREQYRQIRDRLAEKTTGHEAGRLAEYGAVVILAATLAHAALDLPWSFKDPLESIWAAVTAEAADAAGELKALRDVVDWAYAHPKTFYGRQDFDRDGNAKLPGSGYSGRWDSGEDWSFLAFHPTKLKPLLAEMGYEPAAILHGWKERGWLDTGTDDATRITKKTRLDGENPYLIVLPRDRGIKEAEAC